jgi:hypothetical protein
MKLISPLRGLAVLALLCLALPLRAATIVQATSVDTSLVADGFGAMIFDWTYQPFDPALGVLTSVVLSVSIEGQMSTTAGWFGGPFDGPIEVTPQAVFNSTIFTTDESSGGGTVSAIGAPVLLPVAGFVAISSPIFLTFEIVNTDAARLANYSSFNPYGHRLFSRGEIQSNAYNGGVRGNVSTDLTLTYTYEVPDAGNGIALFGLAFVGLVVGHRRIIADSASRR